MCLFILDKIVILAKEPCECDTSDPALFEPFGHFVVLHKLPLVSQRGLSESQLLGEKEARVRIRVPRF